MIEKEFRDPAVAAEYMSGHCIEACVIGEEGEWKMPELYCKVCGNIFVQPTDRFCRKCGAPLGSKAVIPEPALSTQAARTKIDRLVIVGDRYTPTREDLDKVIHLLQETRPDLSTRGCIVTSLEWPGGVTQEYTAEGMDAAIMKSDWGRAVLLKYFKTDIDNGAKIFFLEYANAAGQREIAIVATGGAPAVEEKAGEQDRFQPLTQWIRYPSLHPISQVSLETLASPLLKRHAPTGVEPAAARKEQIRRLVSPASRYHKEEDCQALEVATRNLPADFPGFALGYLWRCIAFAGLNRFEEACSLLDTGLEVCADPLQICSACSHLFEQTGSLAQFGWHMQECFLSTDSFWPYLVLGQASLASGMHDLSKSLFAASDVLSRDDGMWRPSPEQIKRIDDLVRKNLPAMMAALAKFTASMEPALTALRVVPEDPSLRKQWLQEDNPSRKELWKYMISGRKNVQ